MRARRGTGGLGQLGRLSGHLVEPGRVGAGRVGRDRELGARRHRQGARRLANPTPNPSPNPNPNPSPNPNPNPSPSPSPNPTKARDASRRALGKVEALGASLESASETLGKASELGRASAARASQAAGALRKG